MSHDKEQEIRRQFLDEAQDYLNALDEAVMGLAGGRIEIQKVNAALRATHSIKGGAGLMGYMHLSEFAHRLEDSFKVLKTQSQSLEIDPDLENLLLQAVTHLRTLIHQHQHDQPLEPGWIDWEIAPVFDQLVERLGEPPDENAASVFATDNGLDIIPVLFETEVENCLQRLEAVLAEADPHSIQEELTLLTQELGGLGEMLQLDAFSQLCSMVAQTLENLPLDNLSKAVMEIAQSALQAWRKSQALVLAGQLDLLPTAIAGSFAQEPPADRASVFTEAWEAPKMVQADQPERYDDSLVAIQNYPLDTADLSILEEAELVSISEPFVDAEELPNSEQYSPPASAPQLRDEPTRPLDSESAQGYATMRVSVRNLNQLNDLFGELTIQRNGLDLYLKRLRSLSRLLIQRSRLLEASNAQLRSAYDRIIPRSLGRSRFSPLPPTIHRDANGSPQTLNLGNGFNTSAYFNWPPTHYPESSRDFSHQLGFDSLELDRYTDLHLLSQQVMETIVQLQEVSSDIELCLDDAEQANRDLGKTSKLLQSDLNQIRMCPLSDVVDRFPRALRELCLQHHKKVELTIQGADTLIERNILEALNDPLLHLLRNAFDHGIETPRRRIEQGKPEIGLITIRAFHRGNRTIIQISDDGQGIPLEKVRAKAEQMGLDPALLATASEQDLLSLIFEPGFSTRDRVTTLSGRGVGMDVVRDSLRQIRGDIQVDTQAGVGTTFTLSVPFTLTVVQVLFAESNGLLLAFPTDVIQETVLLPKADTATAEETLLWQNTPIRRVSLARWLQFHCPCHPHAWETPANIDAPLALIVRQGSQPVAIEVERCWAEQEVTIRHVDGNIRMPEGFTGCAIVGDGRVVPLVNVSELLDWVIACEHDAQGRGEAHTTMPRVPLASSVVNPILLNPALLSPGLLSPASPRRSITPPPTTPPFSRPQTVQPVSPSPHGVTTPTILIVDDSINIRRFLALTLERAGFQVEQAKDGQDALDKLQRGLSVQAVICDIEMPRLDGYGFLAKFKAQAAYEHIPVAMLTSRSSEKHRQLANSLGASAYFSKPYNEQALLQTLLDLVAAESLCNA
jgi:two-component system, chemotaxis family, sensor histidine kinase and response regulator PixL